MAAPIDSTTELFVDIGLYLSYILLFASAITAVAWPIIHSVNNPKQLKMIGLSIASLLILFLISYGFSGSEVIPVYEKFDIDSSDSKIIGGSMIMMYLMTLIAVGGMLYSEIFSGIIKRK